MAMSEKCIVTTYEKDEFISIIRHAFAEELKALKKIIRTKRTNTLIVKKQPAF